MNEHDIAEAFDFELQLTKLLLKDEAWKHEPKRFILSNAKLSKALPNGVVRISDKYIGTRDYVDLRYDLRCLFADMHCGFVKRDKFLWQRIAKKLGAITETDAIDLTECELCGKLTPLTRTKRCMVCRQIEEAVLKNPALARKILAQFDIARKVLNQHEGVKK
jgi:hypothetical protein